MALTPYNPLHGAERSGQRVAPLSNRHFFKRTAAENSVADADGILDGTALTCRGAEY